MNPLFAAALDLQQFCRARAWRFCFIGGLAVQRWGEPRLTLDVGCSVMTGIGDEASYVHALLAALLLVSHSSGIPLDISLGAMPFEAHSIERASPITLAAASR